MGSATIAGAARSSTRTKSCLPAPTPVGGTKVSTLAVCERIVPWHCRTPVCTLPSTHTAFATQLRPTASAT